MNGSVNVAHFVHDTLYFPYIRFYINLTDRFFVVVFFSVSWSNNPKPPSSPQSSAWVEPATKMDSEPKFNNDDPNVTLTIRLIMQGKVNV
jgi:hypothetical protein